LKEEAVRALGVRKNGIYVDCTLGEGGHAEAILEATAPDGRLFGIDRDEVAIRKTGERLIRFGSRVRLLHDSFKNLGTLLKAQGVEAVDGILMDLGVSALQLRDPERGFSFQKDGPLDMRMDRRSPVTAADLVNSLSEREMARVVFEYGEERWARRIARAVVEARKAKPITRTLELAELIRRAVPPPARSGRLHPATRTFQALRVLVNRELDQLDEALLDAIACLHPGGRLCVIAFHSLEDRIVKSTFRQLSRSQPAPVRLLTKKPTVPDQDEIRENPRARSARLRVVERNPAVAVCDEGRGE